MSEAHPSLLLVPDRLGFLRATAPRGVSLRWLLGAIDDVRRASAQGNGARLLADLRDVDPPSPVEQAIFGEHAARELPHIERLASLVAHGTRTGYSERVARALHLNVQTFTSEAEAIAWLTE